MIQSIESIKKQIEETIASNRNDIYNSHLYWSQKPYNICDILIENFSNDGEVILDPFMGSGVTIIQAIQKRFNRKAIGVEINEVPIFIVNTVLQKYDIVEINNIVKQFINKVNRLSYYYETKCVLCGEKGIIQKVVFDRENWKSPIVIKEIHYKCKCNKKSLVKDAALEDNEKMNNINEKISYIKDECLITNSRLAVYEGQRISNIFTKRNFVILDKIIEIINEEFEEYSDILKYILLSSIHLSKITDTHSNSQWPLWTPKKNCVEKNVIEIMNKRAKHFLKAIKYAEQELSVNRKKVNKFNELDDGEYIILDKSIQSVSNDDIPNNSVDLVITDPPYLGQVLYSEYMQLYKPILGFKFNLEDEIVVSSSPERNKKEAEYYLLLERAFKVVSSKLKSNSYMCMYFHDSNLSVWDKLIKILDSVGLRYISQVHVKKKHTLKNIISPKKSLNGDAILFFIKESVVYDKKELELESIEEIERNIIKHAKYNIKTKGPLTTPQLYDDGIMEVIIHNGWLTKLAQYYKSLVDIFEKYLIWDKDISKWKID